MSKYSTYTTKQVVLTALRLAFAIPLIFYLSILAFIAKTLGYKAHDRQRLAASLTDRVAKAVRAIGGSSKYCSLKNGHTLHYVEAGPPSAPVVLLLHGFPDSWFVWKNVIPDLAAAGYRVIAPDQLGAGFSSKPRDAAKYTATALSADYLALMDTLGVKEFGLVGHDFGGVFAWRLAKAVPDRVRGFVSVCTPPGEAWVKMIKSFTWEQILASWYMLYFNLPLLPEALLGLRPEFTAKMLGSATGQTFDEETLGMYAAQMAVPGALTTMLNVYRGFRHRSPKGTLPATPNQGAGVSKGQIGISGLLLAATHDAFLPPAGVAATKDVAPRMLVKSIDTGHWATHEAGPIIATHIIAQMKRKN